MSSTGDKIKGTVNDVIGNVKQGLGKATGNEELRAEGLAQEAKGEAQKVSGTAKAGVEKVADSLTGKR